MKNSLVILTGVSALAAGVAGGYFYAQHTLASDFEERLNEETAKLREKYYNIGVEREDDVKAREVSLRETQEYLEDLTGYLETKYDVGDIYAEIPKEVHASFTNYNKLTNSYSNRSPKEKLTENQDEDVNDDEPVELQVTDEEVSPVDFELPDDEYQEAPYFINDQMFLDNEYEYDQSSMTYFIQDELLLDDHDHIFDQERHMSEVNKLLKMIPLDGPDLYFIRHNAKKIELEIVIVKSSFEEVNGG